MPAPKPLATDATLASLWEQVVHLRAFLDAGRQLEYNRATCE